MRILGLSSDGLLGYEAPRSGAFRKFFGPGGGHFLDAGPFLFRPRARPRKCVSRGGDETLLVGEPVNRSVVVGTTLLTRRTNNNNTTKLK